MSYDESDVITLTNSGFLNKGNYVNRDYDVTLYIARPSEDGTYDLLEGRTDASSLYGQAIGRAKNLSYAVMQQAHEYFEAGSIEPAELRPGNRTYSGSFERGFINVALLRLILGSTIKTLDLDNLLNLQVSHKSSGNSLPLQFDLHWHTRDSGYKSGVDPANNPHKTIIFHGAILTSDVGTSRENEYFIESVTFKAKKMTTLYAGLSEV